MSNSEPVSMVGCQYKIISKILTKRLRLVFGEVISEDYSRFMNERSILYGVLTTNEVVNRLRKKKKNGALFKGSHKKIEKWKLYWL